MRRIFILVFFFLIIPKNSFAVTLSVEAPQDTLVRDQVFDFKINIDTKGQKVTKQEMNVTYDTQSVQFDDVVEAGDFFDSVEFSEVEKGKIYIVADSSAGKSGTGLVAIVKLKIIAQSPGSTQLCAVLPVTPTPQKTPTPTVHQYVTSVPAPPRTGAVENIIGGATAGIVLLSAAVIFWYLAL